MHGLLTSICRPYFKWDTRLNVTYFIATYQDAYKSELLQNRIQVFIEHLVTFFCADTLLDG